MGKTSAAAKNRYNDKAYDRINLTVKKGDKEKIQVCALEHGESVNAYINRLIREDMAKKEEE